MKYTGKSDISNYGAARSVLKSLSKHPNHVHRIHSEKDMHKTAILGVAFSLMEFVLYM